jgi:hypothetical protein
VVKKYNREWQFITIDKEEFGEFWRGKYSDCDCCQQNKPTLCLEISEGLEDSHMARICAHCLRAIADDLTTWDAKKNSED